LSWMRFDSSACTATDLVMPLANMPSLEKHSFNSWKDSSCALRAHHCAQTIRWQRHAAHWSAVQLIQQFKLFVVAAVSVLMWCGAWAAVEGAK